MLHINVICVGKIKESFFRDAILEYSKRLSRFCNLTITELQDEKIPEKASEKIEQEIKEKEGQNIISHIKKDSYVIALDLTGKELDSVALSQKIENLSISNSSITFIIGGSLGLSKQVLNYCNEKLCFSKMTFPHQLIRIFLLEQIYRAFKIANNDSIVINESKSGKFGRTLDAMPATLLNNNQPLNGNISMEIHSADEDKSKTPKSYVRFYGVAAMYKKVNVELNQPPTQEYCIGNV